MARRRRPRTFATDAAAAEAEQRWLEERRAAAAEKEAYRAMQAVRHSLPAHQQRAEIIDAIANNPVVASLVPAFVCSRVRACLGSHARLRACGRVPRSRWPNSAVAPPSLP